MHQTLHQEGVSGTPSSRLMPRLSRSHIWIYAWLPNLFLALQTVTNIWVTKSSEPMRHTMTLKNMSVGAWWYLARCRDHQTIRLTAEKNLVTLGICIQNGQLHQRLDNLQALYRSKTEHLSYEISRTAETVLIDQEAVSGIGSCGGWTYKEIVQWRQIALLLPTYIKHPSEFSHDTQTPRYLKKPYQPHSNSSGVCWDW